MKRPATAGADTVLVSWLSVNHRSAPLTTALRDPGSVLPSRIRRLYLCWRDAPAPDGERERHALDETIKELRRDLKPHCPELITLPWKTKAAPTDHAAIRIFAEEVLKRVRDENPDSTLVIHLSPGTPAMHAVWLVLGTTGFVSGPVTLIQTADERGRASGKPPVEIIPFDLDTWLQRYRKMMPDHGGDSDDGQLWDPVRVKSRALREALSKIREWAPLHVPVLLIGERGTGKTTLANFLRASSPFQKRQGTGWPTVVCGQFRVNPQLARSELFGHARGAFTGATSDREGILEQADGDTVFFDEIADIDRDTQRLLMAAIEGRGFRRLGDTKPRKPRFRIVCATNRSLPVLRSEYLDADFYDRIAFFVLEVPPLRHCTEDLPDAWRQVLTQAVRSAGVKPAGWQAFADHQPLLDRIQSHPLPGNFRDLQRTAFHLLAALNAHHSQREVFDAAVRALDDGMRAEPELRAPSNLVFQLPIDNLGTRIDDYRRAWIDAALEQAAGNKSKAARLLGVPRKTLDHYLTKA